MLALDGQVPLPHEVACPREPHVAPMALPAVTGDDDPEGMPLGTSGHVGHGHLVVPAHCPINSQVFYFRYSIDAG